MIVIKLRITIKKWLFLEGGKRSKGLALWRFTAGQQHNNGTLHFLPFQLVQPSAAQLYVRLHYPFHPSIGFIQHLRIIILTTLPVLLPTTGCQHSKAPGQNVSMGTRSPEPRGGELIDHIQI